jgi:pimeloyl-ACP methyl ester carboxylesterase
MNVSDVAFRISDVGSFSVNDCDRSGGSRGIVWCEDRHDCPEVHRTPGPAGRERWRSGGALAVAAGWRSVDSVTAVGDNWPGMAQVEGFGASHTPKSSAASRQLLAQARVPVEEIAPSGHWPFVDQPDAFTATLARFLDEVG